MDGRGGDVVLQTLQLLEWRLRRLEYVLSGQAGVQVEASNEASSVVRRIGKLEENLSKLTARSPVISELVALESHHPEIFDDVPDRSKTDEPDGRTRLAMVLTEAPSFPTTASQLTQLNDLPLPPTEAFTRLIAQLPRLASIDRKQAGQTREIAELRKRSAMLLLRWQELFVLGQGRCWAEWDSRMNKAEKTVRREEIKRLADA